MSPINFINPRSPCLFLYDSKLSGSYHYEEFLQVPTDANAVMSGSYLPADSVIEPLLQSSVNNRGDSRELGMAASGIQPGGILYGDWVPINQRQNKYKSIARKDSDSSGSFNMFPNTGRSSQNGVSTRPSDSGVIIGGGTQVQPAEKKRFRTSQEFKIERKISNGISPPTRTTYSGNLMAQAEYRIISEIILDINWFRMTPNLLLIPRILLECSLVRYLVMKWTPITPLYNKPRVHPQENMSSL